jgi:Ca-activated chloride channel family protein
MKTVFSFCIAGLIFGYALFSLQAGNTFLHGQIADAETGEGLPGATITLYQGEKLVTGAAADFDGKYSLSLDPGTYDIKVAYVGYQETKIAGVKIKAGKANRLDVQMSAPSQLLEEVVIVDYSVPLIEKDNTTQGQTITSKEIRRLPEKNINTLASQTAGLSGKDKKNKVAVRGKHSKTTEYSVDGIRTSSPQVQEEAVTLYSDEDRSEGELEIEPPRTTAPPPPPPPVIQEVPADKTSKAADQKKKPEKKKEPKKVPPPPPPPSEPESGEEYHPIHENNFITPAGDAAFSTFSIDVDNASYSNIRRFIQEGVAPHPDAVRIEEMINYFSYDYPLPEGEHPFTITTELGECPWEEGHQLLHIGLQGEFIPFEQSPPSNLVFLIDVSGSMSAPYKLELLKPAFKMLIDRLRPADQVSLVVYAGAAGLVLPPTRADKKAEIKAAIDRLNAGGSTAGGAGIQLAYKTAIDNYIKGGNNRVILATDGDFNVGISGRDGLGKLIEEKRKEGVFLSVLGFGMGNYKDNRLEVLADKGNGNYAYIDNIREAKKVFVEELSSTLFTIAKDVKIQLEFDPRYVKSYRLIGYENRLLAKEDFDDDSKDAGELGAGHTVTALYQIVPQENPPSEGNAVFIKFRYKAPDGEKSKLILHPTHAVSKSLEETSDNFRFSAAVAGFGMLLRNSKHKGILNHKKVLKLAQEAKGSDTFGYRQEFLELVKESKSLGTISSR